MGLKENRAAQKVQDQQASFDKKLSDYIGKEYSFTVNWDSFMENEKAISMLPGGLFARVSKGFSKVCKDDLGKEAVHESLKAITVEHVEDPSQKSLTFEDGTLSIVVALHNTSKGIFTDTEYAKAINDAL